MKAVACVIGAGGWGTAMAVHLARKGLSVRLLPRRNDHAEALRSQGENAVYLPGIALVGVDVVAGPGGLAGADLVCVATPSHAVRETVRGLRAHLADEAIVLSLAKGLEEGTGKRMTEVLGEELPGHRRLGALSGPNFAREVGLGLVSATVVSSSDRETMAQAQRLIGDERLRVYTNADITGVELGGALKNIYAIGAGMVEGLGLGGNASAAFITRSLAELVRLGTAMGASALTFAGLSGLGDLLLTCTGSQSRNRSTGVELGKGRRLPDILAGTPMVVEGARTTRVAKDMAGRHGVDMPICLELHAVLFEGRSPAEAVRSLMARALTQEREEPVVPRFQA